MGASGSQENQTKKPVVIVIGGGYGGIECARSLDDTNRFFVVLIDRKSYFLHNVGALRATVQPEFARQIVIPYDRLLKNGCTIQAEVISISNDSVEVHGRHEPIHFDYLVIATGSSYAFPGKVAETDSAKAIALYDDLHKKLEKSEKILIIGGGAVGIELAGEIATDYPSKEVTLVHSKETLLEPKVFQEKVYTRTQEQLEKLNVKIILNDRVRIANDQHLNYIEGTKTYTTERTRTNITANLTFLCTGARVNNKSFLNGPLKSKINPQTGRLIVNNYLQIDGFENIFAIGDIADKEGKYAFLAGFQAEYVAQLITLLNKKKPYPKPYEIHTTPVILLSVGRNGGAGQLPIRGGTTIGGFLTKILKSGDMFTSRQRAKLLHTSASQSTSPDKLYSVQSVLSFTEEDARALLAGLPAKELEPGQDFI